MCEDVAPGPQEEPVIAVDTDSAIESSLGNISDTTSLASSVKNYVYENGRRYHSYHHGEYILPNDEDEQDRLDLSHHVYNLVLGGELFRAPVKNPQRVLDMGTGTGIWAIDFADENPQAEVIGTDLSPIQPRWVPPNLRFEIDDFEAEWQFSREFDFIHGRELEGSIRDPGRLFAQCYKNLRPGGFLEMKTIEVTTYSDDGSHKKAKNLLRMIEVMHQAADKFGKSMTTVKTWKEKMEEAGFKNVVQEEYKLPQSPWSEDEKLKQIGVFQQHNLLEALGPYTYALFTRFLNWKREEIEVLLAGARKEIKDLSHHLYTKLYVIYGQKPEDDELEPHSRFDRCVADAGSSHLFFLKKKRKKS
ncbi:hypothetical protein VTN77DRAFT_4615 [Rasamsonia byssochlamydoides]|uniref:uncharacterized protein n=1 Tax=Rasamsonia byssochlamydoides TaxID=89139 RepID=UPI0037429938